MFEGFNKFINIVGYGSQGQAWVHNLSSSGWNVHLYLREAGKSFALAKQSGFNPRSLSELSGALESAAPNGTAASGAEMKVGAQIIALLCPDEEISKIYDEHLAKIDAPLIIVIAHGFAVASGALKMRDDLHQVVLLAPKAIGPKLIQKYKEAPHHSHTLLGAVSASSESGKIALLQVAQGLGFQEQNLVWTDFEKETTGDLISEQILLCGGVFNLMAWAIEEMRDAGIPERLIRQECLTELELVAGLIEEKGMAAAFEKISSAAQYGTLEVKKILDQSGLKNMFSEQVQKIRSGEFAKSFLSADWKEQHSSYIRNMRNLEKWNESTQNDKE